MCALDSLPLPSLKALEEALKQQAEPELMQLLRGRRNRRIIQDQCPHSSAIADNLRAWIAFDDELVGFSHKRGRE